ncbi:MAG: membrane protein insertase YidC [Bacteroidales bacterium]|jgi:YidC/Oxa1 family membrane protein insertase
MDRQTIVGLILIFLLLSVFSIWRNKNMPKPEPATTQTVLTDSISASDTTQTTSLLSDLELDNEGVTSDSIKKIIRIDTYGAFSESVEGEEEYYTVESDILKLTFSNLGGKLYSVELKEFTTFDDQPLILFEGDNNEFGLSFFSNNRLIQTSMMYFQPYNLDNKITSVNSEDGKDVSFRLYAADNGEVDNSKYLEFLYHIPKSDYMIDFSVNYVNMEDVIASNNGFIDLLWSLDLRQQEKLKDSRLNISNIHYKYLGDKDISQLKVKKNGSASNDLSVKTEWVSFKQQFFTSTIIADNEEGFLSGAINAEVDPTKNSTVDRYLKTMTARLTLPYYGQSESESFDMRMYFGPTKFKELKKYKIGLEDQIILGKFFLVKWINKYVVIAVFNFLDNFNWSYGIIILVLTILLKIVLFPVTYKSYLNGARTRALKPEMDAINKKYPNSEDAMAKQQEIMALYKKFGVNPMSGCLPMLLQFPILIAMFRFFPVSFELRQQPFLWADDLSSYDSILDLPFNIPFYGDHISLFALLMAASTIIYTMINNKNMGQQSQPGIKFMTYAMPILFLGIFNNYSSGLSYYYLLVNLISFLQMFIISKIKPQEKLREELLLKAEEIKTKKKKKSKWQHKLEEMQRMQQQQARENAKRRKY